MGEEAIVARRGMNIFFKSLVCVALGGAALGLGGCGGGGINPNPTNFGPTTLSGSLTSSSFYDTGSKRYYDIYVCDALDSDVARVAMRSGDFDTQFYIYEKDADGNYKEIDSNDDANSNTSDSDDTFDVTRGNTYRILATSAKSSSGLGAYQIRFSEDLSKPALVATNDQSFAKSQLKFSLPPAGK